jgi:hypothetical protein
MVQARVEEAKAKKMNLCRPSKQQRDKSRKSGPLEDGTAGHSPDVWESGTSSAWEVLKSNGAQKSVEAPAIST